MLTNVTQLVASVSAIQHSCLAHTMPLECSGKWGTEVSQCVRSVITLGSQVPSTFELVQKKII